MYPAQTLEATLELYLSRDTASLEGYTTDILASIRQWLRKLRDWVPARRPAPQPWQTDEYERHLQEISTSTAAQEALQLGTTPALFKGPQLGWLCRQGQLVPSLYDAWNAELEVYRTLIARETPVAMAYLDWAMNATQSILLADHRGEVPNYDDWASQRPPTVAESLGEEAVLWMGYARPRPLVKRLPSPVGPMAILDTHVELYSQKSSLALLPWKPAQAVQFLALRASMTELSQQLEGLFERFESRIEHLQDYRRLIHPEQDHPILSYLDQEMMTFYLLNLFIRLYNRLHGLTDAIAWCLYTFEHR